jgi:cobalt-zinc-cadmium efflux system outer membrane protein
LGLSQEIPAWGALRFAGKAGMTSALATEKELEVLRNQLIAQTHDYFYSSLYARKKLELLAVACEDADETARLMKVRVEKGDAPEIAWMRAGAEFGKFRAEKEVAVKDLETQRARLAELCGLSPDTLPECVGEIAPIQNVFPPVSAIQNRLETNARGEARILREEAAELLVEAERRAGRPTVALRAGLRRHDADDANAIDLGVSVGLPLFNRNQGAAAAARARRQRLIAEHEAQLREEVREAIRLHGEIDAALAAAEQLRTGVLPQYAAVCSALEKALEIGGITLVDLIHERRNLIETQLQHLEYETQARNAATALNRIIM